MGLFERLLVGSSGNTLPETQHPHTYPGAINMVNPQAMNNLGNAYGQQYGSQSSQAAQTAVVQKRRLNSGLQQKQVPFDPNKLEAFRIPLTTLVTMWQVKYGDQWVNGDVPISPNDEAFYIDGLRRLLSAGVFEQYNGWVRLKENVEKILADR